MSAAKSSGTEETELVTEVYNGVQEEDVGFAQWEFDFD